MGVHITSLQVGKKPPRVEKVLRLEDNTQQNRMARLPLLIYIAPAHLTVSIL